MSVKKYQVVIKDNRIHLPVGNTLTDSLVVNYKDYLKLEQKLKIATDALEFYGDSETYYQSEDYFGDLKAPDICDDNGKKARQALEKINTCE